MSDIEHLVKVLTLDASFADELKKLEAEGYELLPGVLPVVVYNLIRKKSGEHQPGLGGAGQVSIDESKVLVLRDGKLIPLAEAYQ